MHYAQHLTALPPFPSPLLLCRKTNYSQNCSRSQHLVYPPRQLAPLPTFCTLERFPSTQLQLLLLPKSERCTEVEHTSALDNKTAAPCAQGECFEARCETWREVCALLLPTLALLRFPWVSGRNSPSSITGVPVILSETIVFSSKLMAITVTNHPHRTVPTRTSYHPKCSRKPVRKKTLIRKCWVWSVFQQRKIQTEYVPVHFRTSRLFQREMPNQTTLDVFVMTVGSFLSQSGVQCQAQPNRMAPAVRASGKGG